MPEMRRTSRFTHQERWEALLHAAEIYTRLMEGDLRADEIQERTLKSEARRGQQLATFGLLLMVGAMAADQEPGLRVCNDGEEDVPVDEIFNPNGEPPRYFRCRGHSNSVHCYQPDGTLIDCP